MHVFSQNSQNWFAVKFDLRSVMMVFRKPKAMQDVGDEINDSIWRELGYRFVLNPLGKLVDCYQYVGETTWRRCKWPNHIKAPTSKWAGWRCGDKIVGWNMRLLAKELTILASSHQVFSI
jgi:hypothetical protein